MDIGRDLRWTPKKLEYGPGTIYAGVPAFLKVLGLEDGHIPIFWLQL